MLYSEDISPPSPIRRQLREFYRKDEAEVLEYLLPPGRFG